MKQLFLLVIILCTFGVLHAQETPPAADKAALITHLETAAGFVIGGEIGIGVGYGVFVVGSIISPTIDALQVGGLVLIPLGYVASTIAYSNLLETYNSAFPSDQQIMLPYLLLTLSGTASFLNAYLASMDLSGSGATASQARIDRAVLAGVLTVPGSIAYVAGMIVAVAHTQELLAKAKASSSAAVSQYAVQPSNRTVVTPEIGIGYLGVAISMP